MKVGNQSFKWRGMDRIESMRILLKVVECGSLSAVSRALGIPLTTVSRHLSDLEAHVGARILVRSARKTTLTEAGVAYAESIRTALDLLRDAEQAVSDAHSGLRGVIRMTAPVVMGRTHLGPLVCDFLAAHPEIDIHLRLSDTVAPLIQDRLDLAVRIGHLPDSSLTAIEIGRVRRVTCASPAYLAANGSPVTPGDLVRHQCVTFDNLAAADAWRFNESGAARAVSVRSRLVVTTAEAAVEAAEAGLGITRLLSYQVGDAVSRGSLVVLLSAYELPCWPVHLVYQSQKNKPRRLAAFLDYATARLQKRLAREASLFDRSPSRDAPP